MAWKPPQVNQIVADISTLSIYLRSVKKFGKTTLFRDVVIEKYGDPTYGLLVGCGSEIGYAMLDNLNYTQVESYADLVELGNWLITKKGIEHHIKMIAFDTVDELVLICDKETIARSKEDNPGKACRSIKQAMGGFGGGNEYTANNLIKPFMSALKKAGFGIWAIAHTSMKTIKNKGDLEEDGYQMLTSNLEKKAESAFGDIFDVTLTGVIDRSFHSKTKDGFNGKKIKENFVDEEVRKLYFRGTSIIDAGGRFAYGSVPEYLVFNKGNMAAEFIKTVENGIEKSKTDFSPVNKVIHAEEKQTIKEDNDDPGISTNSGIFGDDVGAPTEDINLIKQQIIARCKELGGSRDPFVKGAVAQYGNPNALTDIDKAKEYYNYVMNKKD